MINMAMGLELLGRGGRWKALRVGLCHVLGAAFAGAALAGFLGWLGTLIPFSSYHSWIILLLGVFALWHSLAHRAPKLGRQCQVNRRWRVRISAELAYFLWGLQLGCGILTVIPYSCFLVLLGVQFTSGVVPALLSGALYGFVREATILTVLLRQPDPEWNPSRLMRLLSTLKPTASLLNRACIIVGVPLLLLSWR